MVEAFYVAKGEAEAVYVDVYNYGKLIGSVLVDE